VFWRRQTSQHVGASGPLSQDDRFKPPSAAVSGPRPCQGHEGSSGQATGAVGGGQNDCDVQVVVRAHLAVPTP